MLFEAGYKLKRRRFLRNGSYISVYGILGTWISFIVIVLVSYHFSKLDINDCFALGSVLVASDFAPVLAVISEER